MLQGMGNMHGGMVAAQCAKVLRIMTSHEAHLSLWMFSCNRPFQVSPACQVSGRHIAYKVQDKFASQTHLSAGVVSCNRPFQVSPHARSAADTLQHELQHTRVRSDYKAYLSVGMVSCRRPFQVSPACQVSGTACRGSQQPSWGLLKHMQLTTAELKRNKCHVLDVLQTFRTTICKVDFPCFT